MIALVSERDLREVVSDWAFWHRRCLQVVSLTKMNGYYELTTRTDTEGMRFSCLKELDAFLRKKGWVIECVKKDESENWKILISPAIFFVSVGEFFGMFESK